MKALRSATVLAALVACSTGRIPAHLQPPDAPAGATREASFSDLPGLHRAMIGRDPMGRAVTAVDAQAVARIDGAEPYVALLAAAERLGPDADEALRSLRALEAAHRGTPIVPFSRGIRLREIEGTVGGSPALAGDTETHLLRLLTPLSTTEDNAALPRRPLAWLAGDRPLKDALLVAGDRWTLAGWLDGPDMDLQPVSDALRAAPYDALRKTPTARLILARVAGARDQTEPGLTDLDTASRLLLIEAVQDDTSGRARSAEAWAAIGEDLSADDPRDALLVRAEERLRDAAATDEGAGGALLALQARRLWGSCPNPPCVGLDRVDALGAAARWDPRVARYARRLQVAALHDAIDGIEVAQQTVRYPAAAADLADALVGTGAVPPDTLVLRQRSPDASTWLTLGRSVGVDPCTTWEEARAALRAWAARQARAALETETDDEARAALLEIVRAGS